MFTVHRAVRRPAATLLGRSYARVPRRTFSPHTRLSFIPRPNSRPQLPFLYSTSFRYQARTGLEGRLGRFLTTEHGRNLKQAAWSAARLTAVFWMIIGLFAVAKLGIESELSERAFPTPEEWSMMSRYKLRKAKMQENGNGDTSAAVDWARAGDFYRQLLARLEDPNGDGAKISQSLGEGEDIYVEGVGHTGLDISHLSEPWRRGYFEALMGAGRAAENLDGWVRDTKQSVAFPPEVVIGPSNPRPTPIPMGSQKAPLEEDCEPAFEHPRVYYLKVLTTNGFSSRQKIDAALSLARFFDSKSLPESAEDMCKWALDIAIAGSPSSSPFVDRSSGMLKASKELALTSNLLTATTALASHYAQNGNLSGALPVFLSLLQAQQNLPEPPAQPQQQPEDSKGFLSSAWQALLPRPYPAAPPSGNDPLTRTALVKCLEAGTSLHIGELLFASAMLEGSARTDRSNLLKQGLSWTQRSVDSAESTIQSLRDESLQGGVGDGQPSESRSRCTECLEAGLSNWLRMVRWMEQAESAAQAASSEANEKGGSYWSWLPFWGSGSASARENVSEQPGVWKAEAQKARERAVQVRRLLRESGS